MTSWFRQLCVCQLVNPASVFHHSINSCVSSIVILLSASMSFLSFLFPNFQKDILLLFPIFLYLVLQQIKATVKKSLFLLCAFGLTWSTEDRPNLGKEELHSIRSILIFLHASGIPRLLFRDLLFLSFLFLSSIF